MPNPFDSSGVKPEPEPSVNDVEVLEGLFECIECYEGVTSAKYYPQSKRLVWVCSREHENEERGVDLV